MFLTIFVPPFFVRCDALQMDTFTLAETTAQRSYLEYDAAGKLKNGGLDPEAQEISDEFKRPPY